MRIRSDNGMLRRETMLIVNTNPLTFYGEHSRMTDPGEYTHLLGDLPRDLSSLHQIVQNALIHVWKIRKYHPDWLPGRTGEYEARSVVQMLAHSQAKTAAPLTQVRSKEQKLIVDCRHFATLLCALVRHQGIPARVRCGFATYLEETHFQDHWVCEYWDGDRWVMEDPDVGKHDLPQAEFFTGGRAWHLVRSGALAADRFGYDLNERGLWVVRHDLIRDLAALNGDEMLSADNWGLILKDDTELTADEWALLDRAATHTLADDTTFAEMRAFYQNTLALRVPPVIRLYNYVSDEWKDVTLVSQD
jgi:hypothetical protein